MLIGLIKYITVFPLPACYDTCASNLARKRPDRTSASESSLIMSACAVGRGVVSDVRRFGESQNGPSIPDGPLPENLYGSGRARSRARILWR